MIRAVIFDCFGVLTTEGWFAFCETYLQDADKRSEAQAIHDQMNAGYIAYDAYISNVAELTNLTVQEVHKLVTASVANESLFEYIRDVLKPHYKIGMLSNAGANWLDDLFQAWQVALFDGIALSYEMGVIKPDARAYTIAAARLGMLPEECLFIDDHLGYVESAKAVGMQAIEFTDTKTCIATLDQRVISLH